MAFTTSVFDFMSGLPKFMKHEEEYNTIIRKAYIDKEKQPVEGIQLVGQTITPLEHNILQSCRLDNQFTCPGFLDKLKVTIASLAKQSGASHGVSSIKNDKGEVVLEIGCDEPTILSPMKAQIRISDNEVGASMIDRIQLSKLKADIPNLAAGTLSGIALATAQKTLGYKPDTRHLLLKGYLMLMDYTTSISGGSEKMYKKRSKVLKRENITPERLVTEILEHDIVINTCNFTEDEIAYIAMMGQNYPSIKWNKGNIYNSLRIESDDVEFVSEGEINIKEFKPKSPTSMCHMLWAIASKLDAIPDLIDVIKKMRGMPMLLSKLNKLSDCNVHILEFSKSYNLRCATSRLNSWGIDVVRDCNYHATSINVVADCLIGRALCNTFQNILEEIGSIGAIGFQSKDANNDPVINSNLRDYGVKTDDVGMNAVLRDWYAMTRCKCIINFNKYLKSSLIELAQIVRNRGPYEEFFCGPLMFDMPCTYFMNSTMAKNMTWTPDKYNAQNTIEKDNDRQLMAYLMGFSKKMPKVGYNVYGTKLSEVSSAETEKLDLLTAGNYKIVNVNYTIRDVQGRYDIDEVTAEALSNITHPGTRALCRLDVSGKLVFDEYTDEQLEEIETAGTLGKRENEKKQGFDTGSGDEDEIPTRAETIGGQVMKRKRTSDEIKAANQKTRKVPAFINTNVNKRSKEVPKVENDQSILIEKSLGIVTGDIQKGTHKITRFVTKGDGTCGVHAVLQDLALHGFLDPKEHERAHIEFTKRSLDKSWQNIEDLAQVVNKMGMGLSVVVEEDSDKKVAYNFGTNNSVHNIRLYKTKNHYENIYVGEGKEVEIAGSLEGTTPELSAERLDEVESMFKAYKD